MTDKTKAQPEPPTPRPPRQPDLALITYIEKSDEPSNVEPCDTN